MAKKEKNVTATSEVKEESGSTFKLNYNTKSCNECAHVGAMKHLGKPYPVKPCSSCTLGNRYTPNAAAKSRKSMRQKSK